MENTDKTTANYDQAELDKFAQLANRWWDQESEFKPLHDINPLRANYIDLNAPVAEQRLLDVGCGGGILTEAMAQRGALVTGLDAGETQLNVAKLHLLESNLEIDYQLNTAEQFLAQKPEPFDIVTCLEMLEHVPDPSSVVTACAKLTKAGGDIFFSTINRNPKAFLFAIVGAEHLLRLLPRGTHEYEKFIRPSELAQWARNAGLELRGITGMQYNPITKHYRLSDDDVSVNYLIHCHKPDSDSRKAS